jgi:sarcosine/dimethylglycine N-methyltransferase
MNSAAYEVIASAAERRAKNHDYDDVMGAVWRLAVYDPVHEGRPFTNVGGRRALDLIGRLAALRGDAHVLDVGCGLGETSRYLAEQFGCRVTGVDVNHEQIARARALTSAVARVTFEHADVLTWRAPAAYTAVCAVDALSLLPGTFLLVCRLAEVLAGGGTLGIADVVAGPRMTAALREQLWRADGFVSLPSLKDYATLLRAAGYEDVQVLDRGAWAVECFAAIDGTLHARGDEIAREAGAEVVAVWRRIAAAYLDAFQAGALGYAVAVGRVSCV